MVTVKRIEATLGAVVTDVGLADLSTREWASIEAAFHEHALLVFPGQHLTDSEQVAFARRFGEIEIIAGHDEIARVANVSADGTLRPAESPAMQIQRGNEGWHTDSSYMPVSAKASMLSAHVVPSAGGGTEWADMRAAYNALDDDTKALVDGLAAHHSIKYSQAKAGFTNTKLATYGFDIEAPPLRPLVKHHPVTGRPSLFVGRHAHAIVGMDPDESERLLERLVTDACQAPRTYEHRWTPGDLAVWDNRCLLHRARPYDPTEPRVMHHTRVAGDPATETALIPAAPGR